MDCHKDLAKTARRLLHWKGRMPNTELYGELPKVPTKVQQRMRLAGHCIRHTEEVANKLVLWQPTEGRQSRGRRRATYIDTLFEDTETANIQELKTIMEDRDDWKKRVKAASWRTTKVSKFHLNSAYLRF